MLKVHENSDFRENVVISQQSPNGPLTFDKA